MVKLAYLVLWQSVATLLCVPTKPVFWNLRHLMQYLMHVGSGHNHSSLVRGATVYSLIRGR